MTKEELLLQIEKAVKSCRKCRLYRTAMKAVPGAGNPNSKIIFVGEAPGFNEDQQGLPFVGRAGKLLDEMLSEIGLKRADVWIGNIIKHRPPDNRDPMVDEIKACRPYALDQIKAIDPKIIVTLGRFAMDIFLSGAKISEVHGKPFRVSSRIIFPLYHPAAALRSDSVLRELKEDFRKLARASKLKEEEIPFFKNDDNSGNSSQMNLFTL